MSLPKLLGAAAAAALLVSGVGVAANGAGDPVDTDGLTRWSGSDRYTTAAVISQRSVTSTDTVLVASGRDFPDALSAGPAAAGLDGPVLLAGPDGLSSAARQELNRLQPAKVVVIGGPQAVGSVVEAQAADAGVATVTRIAGADRYDTSGQVAETFWPSADLVYLASGRGYADALSGGALAARQGAPVLLSSSSRLAAATAAQLTRLAPSRVVVLGGTSALSSAVVDGVQAAVPGVTVSRISGADRYATSAAVAAAWSTSQRAMFVAGTDFPDALAGVPAAAVNDAPLLLTRDVCMPSAIDARVKALGVTTRILLGGEAVLNDGGATIACGKTGARSLAAAVASLKVASEQGSGYDRDLFQHWIDADGDCQNTRAEVLAAESLVPVSGCTISSGRWYSYYDGATWTAASDVDIDHLVPLAEAWRSGARSWNADTRKRYANDLGDSRTLVAVTDNVNQSKSDKDPAEWLPQRDRCRYAMEWTAVKLRWKLTADSAEKSALARIATGSCGARTIAWNPAPVTSTPPPKPTPKPTPTPTKPPSGRLYEKDILPPPPPDLDCSEIKYRNFIVRPGDPHRFDADGDGIGCES